MLRVWVMAGTLALAIGEVALASEACDEVLQIVGSQHPEVAAGRIEISACARIPGVGTKLMVRGPEEPVEAFRGPNCRHIRILVEALNGEIVDVVPHTDDPAYAAAHAMAPVAVKRVVLDEAAHAMDLVVADEDVQEVTGDGKHHLQLAAELTGWTLNVVSQSRDEQRRDEVKAALERVPGLTEEYAALLLAAGFYSPVAVGTADPGELAGVLGLSVVEAAKIRMAAARVTLEGF